ncbi:hypothetical protein DAI22_07g222500 [Oryza sativa Japonica Group]|nr:hypothetical protein DAI22_07g222500 [Oryza sativa Japonica Group]
MQRWSFSILRVGRWRTGTLLYAPFFLASCSRPLPVCPLRCSHWTRLRRLPSRPWGSAEPQREDCGQTRARRPESYGLVCAAQSDMQAWVGV